MRLIDRYIIRQLYGPFLLGMAGSLTILSFGQFLRALKYLTEGKVEKSLVLKWFVFRVPEDMQYIFPSAAMMATLFVFGRLSRESELAALLASGISLRRLMLPVSVFGAAVTLAVFLFNDWVVPPAMQVSQRIWEDRLRAAGPPNTTFKQDVLVKSDQGRLIYVGHFFLKDASFRRMLIRKYGPGGLVSIITAASGRWKGGGTWTLDSGVETTMLAGGQVVGRAFKGRDIQLSETPADFQQEQTHADEMTLREMFQKIRYLEKRGLSNIRPLLVEMYLKTAFPLSALIFAFIGAAIGISPARSGGLIGFGVSLLFTFLYYVVMSLSSSLGKTGVLDPLVGAWLVNVLFLAACVGLFLRVQAR